MQHYPLTDEEGGLVRQEATDIKPVQMLDDADFSYGYKDQELQCPRSTSVSDADAQPPISEGQQHIKAELLIHTTSDEEGSSGVPDANESSPVALFWNRINPCTFDRALGDEQRIECSPGVNSDNTVAQHRAHHE